MHYLFAMVVTFATWMTPIQGHQSGVFVTYGGQALVEANAEFHGYDIDWSPTRCGIASVSPVMLGQIVWIRNEDGEWVLCYVVDVVQRRHWYNYAAVNGFLADIPRDLMNEWGSPNGAVGVRGELYMGVCPPVGSSRPTRFDPHYQIDTWEPDKAYSGWPYPKQQRPMDCSR